MRRPTWVEEEYDKRDEIETYSDPEERFLWWQGLYSRAFSDGKWLVEIDDISRLTLDGALFLSWKRDYSNVVTLLDSFFNHADYSRGDVLDSVPHMVTYAFAQLHLDQPALASLTLTRLLAAKHRGLAHYEFRNDLFAELDEGCVDWNQAIPSELVSVCNQLILNWPNRRIKKTPLSEDPTYGELASILGWDETRAFERRKTKDE